MRMRMKGDNWFVRAFLESTVTRTVVQAQVKNIHVNDSKQFIPFYNNS